MLHPERAGTADAKGDRFGKTAQEPDVADLFADRVVAKTDRVVCSPHRTRRELALSTGWPVDQTRLPPSKRLYRGRQWEP